MPQQINAVPQKNKDEGLSKALTVGGAIVGGVYGGPSGAVAGAGAGQTASGLLSPPQAQAQPVQTADNAMSRRIQSDDRLQQLIDAKSAVAALPPEQQQQYAAPIDQAYALEMQKRGLA